MPPRPVAINLKTKSRVLTIEFDDGAKYELSCEYLRVHSPSSEVKGHGPGQEVLQTGKENVNISEIEAVGHYAVKLHFDDGHNSGIYGWDYLYDLGKDHDRKWREYLDALERSGYQRK